MSESKVTLAEWYVEFVRLAEAVGWPPTGDMEDYRDAYEDDLTPKDFLCDDISYWA